MRPRDLVDGRYRLIETIRGSAVGWAWLAYDELLGRQVTMEQVAGHQDGGPIVASARAGDPDAAHVFDVLQVAGSSWIVMEHVPRERAVGVAAVPEPTPPVTGRAGRRMARSTRIAVTAAVAILVATTGTALALDLTGRDAPASPAAGPAVRTIVDCAGQSPAGEPVTASPASGRTVPPGWIWHRDPAGFQLPVPAGWTWRSDGEASCFRDPRGDRSLRVHANGPIVADAVGHWADAEQAALADGTLPGYRRIGIAPLDLRGGGADWEFTWQPGSGARRHERRLLLSMGPGRAYVLDWSADDGTWSTSEPILQLIVAAVDSP